MNKNANVATGGVQARGADIEAGPGGKMAGRQQERAGNLPACVSLFQPAV